MEALDLIGRLAAGAPLIPAKNAEAIVPREPGLYSIFISSRDKLDRPYCDYLSGKPVPTLLYIGIAAKSLRVRLVDQDLRHMRASTFFRGMGAILGYRPRPGSLVGNRNLRNYRFSRHDTASIIEWINAYLAVRWVAMTPELAATLEPKAIRELRPLINATHNPDRLAELGALRRECERIALTVV